MSLITLAIWLVVIIALSAILDFVLKQLFHGYKYRFFVAPGVIIHELAHAFACLLVLAKVKEISFFDNKGGFVKHEKSKVPIIGPVVISLAPLVIGIALIYVLTRFVVIGSDVQLSFGLTPANINRIIQTISQLNLVSVRNVILFYLMISVSTTMTPSFQDFTNAFLGLLVTLGALLAANYFFVIKLPETHLIISFSLVTVVLIVGVIFSMILLAFKSLIFS